MNCIVRLCKKNKSRDGGGPVGIFARKKARSTSISTKRPKRRCAGSSTLETLVECRSFVIHFYIFLLPAERKIIPLGEASILMNRTNLVMTWVWIPEVAEHTRRVRHGLIRYDGYRPAHLSSRPGRLEYT